MLSYNMGIRGPNFTFTSQVTGCQLQVAIEKATRLFTDQVIYSETVYTSQLINLKVKVPWIS